MPKFDVKTSLKQLGALEGVERRLMGSILNEVLEGALSGNMDVRDALSRKLHTETGRLAAFGLGRTWTKAIDKIAETLYQTHPEAAQSVCQELANQAARELIQVAALLQTYPEFAVAAEAAKSRYNAIEEAAMQAGDQPDKTALEGTRKVRSNAADKLQISLAEVGQAISGKGTL